MKNYVFLFDAISGRAFSGLLRMVHANFPNLFLGLFLFLTLSCNNSTEENPSVTDLDKARMSFESFLSDPDNKVILFPDEDPGIPIYGRVGPILNQFFVAGDQLVIPFYRNPECIPEHFNLLNYYDPPAAFGCELMVQGRFVIEKDAEEGQFPIMAHTTSSEVSLWIVDWAGFQSLMAEGAVTIVDIEALNPLKATALQYEEYLSPRINEHQVVIEAMGTVKATEQPFVFKLTHEGDKIQTIVLEMEHTR